MRHSPRLRFPPRLTILGLVSLVLITGSAEVHAYMVRGRVLNHADFGRYSSFYLEPRGAPSRLTRLVAHSFETLSYKRVRAPQNAQFILRVSERRKLIRLRVPVPSYAFNYGYGPYWPAPWWGYPCCFYGPGWGWGGPWYGGAVAVPAYRTVTRRVRVIRLTAISARRNIPVWRGVAIARIHGRASLWSIVWHLVNRFPVF